MSWPAWESVQGRIPRGVGPSRLVKWFLLRTMSAVDRTLGPARFRRGDALLQAAEPELRRRRLPRRDRGGAPSPCEYRAEARSSALPGGRDLHALVSGLVAG